jgi:hypothetical protein
MGSSGAKNGTKELSTIEETGVFFYPCISQLMAAVCPRGKSDLPATSLKKLPPSNSLKKGKTGGELVHWSSRGHLSGHQEHLLCLGRFIILNSCFPSYFSDISFAS